MEDSRRNRYEKRQSDAAADIGPLHAVENPNRRKCCSENLLHFLQVYFPESTGLGIFSHDHLEMIDGMELGIRKGGRRVNAVFREFAKTSIAERAALWAVMHGYRNFCPIVGADETSSSDVINSIALELCENLLLFADYPEICVAFHHLEGRYQRCKSQSYCRPGGRTKCAACDATGFDLTSTSGGLAKFKNCKECRGAGDVANPELTHINCVGNQIILPSIQLSAEEAGDLGIPLRADGYTIGSGSIISAHGILSYKRGLKVTLPSGRIVRPDFTIVDDFQTDASAASEVDTRRRLKKIVKAIIPSSGQRKQMAIVVNGTPIEPGDGMEQLLDAKKFPGWTGRRVPMLKQRATEAAEKLWFGMYRDLLHAWDRNSANAEEDKKRARIAATEFYRDNREAMDDGAAATWHTAKEPDELSAVQHCYNVWIDLGEEAFMCEAQMSPQKPLDEVRRLTSEQICSKANGLARGVVPAWATRLTAYIDVQDSCLYWLVLAVTEGYTAHVVDYSVYPSQPSGTLDLSRIKAGLHKIQDAHADMGHEGSLRKAIDTLTQAMFGKDWVREDGRRQKLDWMAIDSADGGNSTVIYEAVRRSPFAAILRAARGHKFGARDATWEEFVAKFKRPTEEFFWHCWETPIESGVRLFKIDGNHWKTFSFQRLAAAPGDVGSLSLFGKPSDHEQFAGQLLNPIPNLMTAESGRKVEEWKTVGGKDDHIFDCLHGAFAVAARVGVIIPSIPQAGRHGQQRRVAVLPQARSGARR